MAYDKDLKALIKASQKLSEGQGMVARRNARLAVMNHLRCLRKALDEEYPVIKKKARRSGRLTTAGKTKRLRSQGLAPYSGNHGGVMLGVTAICETFKLPNPRHSGRLWAPEWLVVCAQNERSLNSREIWRAKRDKAFQDALVAEALLKKTDV